MADISDVLNTLGKAAANAVYPKLTYDAVSEMWDSGKSFDTSRAASVTGDDILVYPGWPPSANLTADLRAGKAHVSIFPRNEERNTTRYPEVSVVTAVPTLYMSMWLSGSTVTLGKYNPSRNYDASGVIWDAPGNFDADFDPVFVIAGDQNLALRINGKFYTYAAKTGQTLGDIATALAAVVAVSIAGTSAANTVISIGSSGRVQAARVGGFGTVSKELRRQERLIQITVWTVDPTKRDVISAAIDVKLAATRFLTMPDGYSARLIYKNTMLVDTDQKALVYRRDLNYLVEYATTISEQRAAVIAPSANLNTEFAITA
jgi:hypothetical protein